MRFWWLALLATLLVLSSCVIYAQEEKSNSGDVDISVIAEGSGAVVDGDMAKAKDDALADAKKNAVEQGVGVFVSAKSLGEDYVEVERTILTRSDGYITSWSVVEGSQKVEKFEGAQLLSIKIKAKIGLLNLIADLSDMEEVYNSMKRPKVMVLINEKNMGKKPEELPASAVSIMSSLQDRKFDVVDPEVIKELIQQQSTRVALETGDTKAAGVIAMKKGAQILVLGTASAKAVDLSDIAGDDVKSASALLSVRIVYADTGEVLYVTPKSVQGRGISVSDEEEAGTKALEDAGSKLISNDTARFTTQILARWTKESHQGRVFRLVVHKVKDSEFESIKTAVTKFRGFANFIGDSSYEGKTGSVDIKFTMPLDSFRSSLRKVKINNKVIEISRTSGTVTECALEKP